MERPGLLDKIRVQSTLRTLIYYLFRFITNLLIIISRSNPAQDDAHNVGTFSSVEISISILRQSPVTDGLQLLIDNHIGFTGWEYRGPSYPDYSVWYQNQTSWVLKPLPYGIYKSKFAQWNSPLDTSVEPSTAPSSLGESPNSVPIPTAPSAAPSKGVKSSAYRSLPHVLLVLVVALALLNN